MWLFTNIGFYSVVQKPGDDQLTVRARVKQDLDALRENYLPTLTPSTGHGGSDYPWRATVTHAEFAAGLGRLAQDIHYPNFKNEVAAQQGKARAQRYAQVWSALYGMEA